MINDIKTAYGIDHIRHEGGIALVHSVCVAGFLWLNMYLFYHNLTYFYTLAREDGSYEYMQVLVLLLCMGLAVELALFLRRDSDRISYLIWAAAVMFFLMAMEEISWGQRIFNFSTPELLNKENLQHETNLHNLNGLSNKLMYFIAGNYAVLSGGFYLLAKIYIPSPQPFRMYLLVVPLRYLPYFVPLIGYYLCFDTLYLGLGRGSLFIQEAIELLFYLGCYYTLLHRLRTLWSSTPQV